MGDEGFSGSLPLLIKLIDAEDILSVQVHPDPETCQRLGRGEPKTECWYIIAAAADAVIYKGLRQGVTKKQFAKAISEGNVAEMLVKVSVKEGQCHFLPAGTAHAIGQGLLIAEIQMPSDTTYRVFDWNRLDNTGKPRELHIAEALESIHFDSSADNLSVTTAGRLADCEYFKIDKDNQDKDSELTLSAGQMKIMLILSGCGRIAGAGDFCTDFKAGDCLLIPAVCEGVVQFADDAQYLTITI